RTAHDPAIGCPKFTSYLAPGDDEGVFHHTPDGHVSVTDNDRIVGAIDLHRSASEHSTTGGTGNLDEPRTSDHARFIEIGDFYFGPTKEQVVDIRGGFQNARCHYQVGW